MDDLYRENILDHYKHPHNWGRLDEADLEFHDLNPLCGDELTVQFVVGEEGRIDDVHFSGHGGSAFPRRRGRRTQCTTRAPTPSG
jgi:nitrogen fixation NifU-like protein